MILTDTHAHLYADEFDKDRDAMICDAIDNGIERMFLPNIDSHSISKLISLHKTYPENCFPMMGLHPCSVKKNFTVEIDIIEHFLKNQNHYTKFYAVGEIGIDLYHEKKFLEEQTEAFEYQIQLAKDLNLPIVIHTRNSFDETFKIVQNMQDGKLKGIFHCFSGDIEQANKILSLGGFKLGVGGVLTFKNSGLEEVVKSIDLKHFVLETDAPYLAPMPHRGKRNESSYITLIAEKIAELKNISIEEVARVTTENSKEIFGV